MRAVIQRVKSACVEVDGELKGSIQKGLIVFLGVEAKDTTDNGVELSKKIARARLFQNATGRMESSLLQSESHEVLIISQFTLFGTLAKGTRVSLHRAARPEAARPLYEAFCKELSELLGGRIQTGVFGADMDIEVRHDGPVSLIIDTKRRDF